MFHVKHSLDATIAAIATPLGIGGVGVVRISGDQAQAIFSQLFIPTNGDKIESHRMIHGWLVDPKNKEKIDQVLACLMKAPKSYTGEDVLELYCHGGIAILQRVLEASIAAGARLARRGEFTKRAYLNGKMDLSQAESVLDLINAQTAEGAGLSVRQLEGKLSRLVSDIRKKLVILQAELEADIDFPEEVPELDYKAIRGELQAQAEAIDGLLRQAEYGRIFRQGLAGVIVGKPNVGKSCLLNALLGEQRAIVTEQPGTTRDTIEETVNLKGIPLRIIDTAGIRHPKDKAEEFGVERAEKELEASDVAMVVLDASTELDELDKAVLAKAQGRPCVVILNKIDLGVKVTEEELREIINNAAVYKISALYGQGLEELKQGMFDLVLAGKGLPGKDSVAINARHKECLARAAENLGKALESCGKSMPADFITIDLKATIVALGEVSGELVSDEVVNTIFEQFCVGK